MVSSLVMAHLVVHLLSGFIDQQGRNVKISVKSMNILTFCKKCVFTSNEWRFLEVNKPYQCLVVMNGCSSIANKQHMASKHRDGMGTLYVPHGLERTRTAYS